MANQLKNEGLINVNSNSPGIYVCKIIYKKGQEMSRVYIPGIHVNPINPDNTLNEAIYAENENSYLLCLWESKAMRDAIPEDKVLSGWIQYCTGDQCFGVIMGYMGKTLIEANSWSGGSGSSNSSYISGSGSTSNMSLVGGQIVGVAVGSGGTVSNSGCPDANVYSLSKDGDKALSTNFKVSEFACHNGDDQILIVPELVTLLENIKSSCNGASISINSAYRSPAYNASIGGASQSMHIYGAAADIVVSGYTPTQVYNIFRQIMPNSGGGGIYSSYTHVDVRYNKADW